MVVDGWLHRQQAATIEYLKAENRMLRARLGGRRIVFTDAERRQLAEKARALGRKALHELGTIVTPETLLRWYRELLARKWTFVERRSPGRPRIRGELVALVVRMANENRGWGNTRIQGAMAILGHKLGRGTIGRILKNHCIEPAPERGKGMSWSVFLKAHWKVLVDSDRAGDAARCAARVRCAFSSRAQSPRSRQCADHAPRLLEASRGTGDSSCSVWRTAQLL